MAEIPPQAACGLCNGDGYYFLCQDLDYCEDDCMRYCDCGEE
jgi:hypothetical protein